MGPADGAAHAINLGEMGHLRLGPWRESGSANVLLLWLSFGRSPGLSLERCLAALAMTPAWP